jgi:osmotically-inducible protein OsmY
VLEQFQTFSDRLSRAIVMRMTQQQRMVFRIRASMRAMALTACLTVALSGCASFGKCGTPQCTADAKISDEVRNLLAQSPAFGANQITVQAIHGVVYLRGLVSTPYLIGEAQSIAEQVPGVTDVRNLLYIDNSK